MTDDDNRVIALRGVMDNIEDVAPADLPPHTTGGAGQGDGSPPASDDVFCKKD